jgi:hypothetical protein
LDGNKELEASLVSLDIVTLGDLIEVKQTGTGITRAWLSRQSLAAAGLADIAPLLRDRPLPTGELTIRVGSCLTLLEGNADVIEFLGWVGEKACVRRWSPVHKVQACRLGSRYMLCSEHRSRGAGSDELLDPTVLLAPSKRVLMGPDEVVGRGQNKHIERRVAIVVDHGPVNFPVTPPPHSLWSDLAGEFRDAGCDLEIYTDAAWECKYGTLQDVFMYGNGRYVIGSGGIVITLAGCDWRDAGVFCHKMFI